MARAPGPRKKAEPPPPAAAQLPDLPRPLEPPPAVRALLTLQSPASDILLEDAAKCLSAADYLDWLVKRVGNDGGIAAKDVASLAACFKTSAQLREQAATSLADAKARFQAERATSVARGLTAVLPSNQSKLLAHARKAIEALAAGADPGDIVDAKPVEAKVA